MRPRKFLTSVEDLPGTLPVFPLYGVLLLPGGHLPLTIFEPRYLAMFNDALASNRLIGMIQPSTGQEQLRNPKLYRTGCAGRVVQFSEIEDGRYLVTLFGLARFDIAKEVDSIRGYRLVVPSWGPYRDDIRPQEDPTIDRGHLLSAVRGYFDVKGIKADWEAIERTDDAQLVTSLAMLCPFDAVEKQALLVAGVPRQRADAMIALMEMAIHPGDGSDNARH